jgi:hypothetical protein
LTHLVLFAIPIVQPQFHHGFRSWPLVSHHVNAKRLATCITDPPFKQLVRHGEIEGVRQIESVMPPSILKAPRALTCTTDMEVLTDFDSLGIGQCE